MKKLLIILLSPFCASAQFSDTTKVKLYCDSAGVKYWTEGYRVVDSTYTCCDPKYRTPEGKWKKARYYWEVTTYYLDRRKWPIDEKVKIIATKPCLN